MNTLLCYLSSLKANELTVFKINSLIIVSNYCSSMKKYWKTAVSGTCGCPVCEVIKCVCWHKKRLC